MSMAQAQKSQLNVNRWGLFARKMIIKDNQKMVINALQWDDIAKNIKVVIKPDEEDQYDKP